MSDERKLGENECKLKSIRELTEVALKESACCADFAKDIFKVLGSSQVEEHYLPISCPLCGRRRLLYQRPHVRCEKCGCDEDALNVVIKDRLTDY